MENYREYRIPRTFQCHFSLAHIAAYFPVAKISKEYSRILPLQVSSVIQLVYLFLIIYLGEKITQVIIPIAILGGLAHGSYWLSDNLLKFDLTHRDNRLQFTAAYQIIKSTAGSIIPLLAGLLVVTDGGIFHSYGKVFTAAIICAVLVLITSFLIPKERNYGKSRYNFFSSASELWKEKNVRIVCYSTTLGEIAGVLPMLIGLLLFLKSGSELSLGGYQFITVLIIVITNYYMGKSFHRKDYKKLLMFGGIANIFCVLILLINQSSSAILLYGILTSLFSFLSAPSSPMRQDVLTMYCKDESQRDAIRIEYITLKEVFDVLGKVIGFAILLFVGTFTNTTTISIVIIMFAISAFADNIMLTRIEEKWKN